MATTIGTKIFIVSDTHGDELDYSGIDTADLAIHCGDLTQGSKLDEYRTTIRLLKSMNAPLKLVIAGNHDFTLDTPVYKRKIKEFKRTSDGEDNDRLLEREYGAFGEARALFDAEDVKAAGIVFLDEGTHRFELVSGAQLTVYASPFTPPTNDWAFQWHPQEHRAWNIDRSVDVVLTHGPPRGVMDYADSQRMGCSGLFAAIARTRPLLHCFGHIHGSWGAKKVAWRDEIGEAPSHFKDIDNDASEVIESLAGIRPLQFDSAETVKEKEAKRAGYREKGFCVARPVVRPGSDTLFINAAVQETYEGVRQLPWMVCIDLPKVPK